MKTKDKIVPLSDEEINKNNIDEYITKTINKYFEKGMLSDAMFWRFAINTLKEKQTEALKNVEEEIENLNVTLRKDNIPQRLSGDELNDLWEEKIKEILKKHFGQFGDEK